MSDVQEDIATNDFELPQEVASQLSQGKLLAAACNDLWPFIRLFPIFGADPAASDAVLSIGKLIGQIDEKDNCHSVNDEIRVSLCQQMTTWIRQHRFIGTWMNRKHADILVHELEARFSGNDFIQLH